MAVRIIGGCAQRHRHTPANLRPSFNVPICGARNHMLLFIGILTAMMVAAIIIRLRVPGGVNDANLGWMSQQWLAEQRASHSS
jgi:hypothetical protein